MKRIKALDDLYEELLKYNTPASEATVSYTFMKAYRTSVEIGRKRIDFDGNLWTRDIPQIVNDLRTYGIKEFSVSDQSTALMEELAAFEAEGCKVTKMTTTKKEYRAWNSENHEVIPAIKLIVK